VRSKSDLLVGEQGRLGVAFRRALLVATAGASAAIACSSSNPDVTPVAPVAEAGIDAPADVITKPDADPCAATKYQPTPKDTCGDYLRYPCGLPKDLTVRGDCYFAVNDCNSLCPDIHYNCHAIVGFCSTNHAPLDAGPDGGDADVPDADFDAGPDDGVVVPDEAGAVIIDCSVCPGSAGRVPAGLAPIAGVSGASVLGAYFANAARLEAASVAAFRRLREELALHGAPEELCAAARDAERDEVRHTLAMARLARRHGGRYVRPHVEAVAPRSLAAVAEENAVEGCARETFGALLATHQAEHAADPAIARAMQAIAVDETRHAALSWAIARWSLTQLDAEQRATISSAWRGAMAGIAGSDGQKDALASAASLPVQEQRARLAHELRDLWDDLLAA